MCGCVYGFNRHKYAGFLMRNLLGFLILIFSVLKLIFNTTLLVHVMFVDYITGLINKKFSELFHDF